MSAANTTERSRNVTCLLAVLAVHLVFGVGVSAAGERPLIVANTVGAAVRGIPVDAMAPMHRDAYLRAIKQQLGKFGYREANADGDRETLSGTIRAYQRDVGLPVDGVASQELLDHLMFVRPRLAITPKPVAAVAPPAREPVIRPVAPSNPSAAPDTIMPKLPLGPVIRQDLSPPSGSSAVGQPERSSNAGGGVISQVQQKLRARGYYKGPVDGAFAPSLAAAIAQYQKDAGLTVTRVIDAPLLNALAADPKTARSSRPAGSP